MTAPRQTVEMINPIQVIFKSKSGKALGPSALKWFSHMQNEIVGFTSTAGDFKDFCLRGSDTSDTTCRILSSPAAIANYATNVPATQATSCPCTGVFGVPCASFDQTCAADFPGLPTCSANVPNKPPAADVSDLAFRALCDNAAGVATLAATTTSLPGSCERASYSLRLDVAGKKWDCDTLNTKWARLLIPYGSPFKAGQYDEEVVEEQREAFKDELVPLLYSLRDEIQEADPDLLVYYWNVDQIGYYLNSDLRFATLATLAIVFMYLMLWWQTESLFITSCGLFEIAISFPLGLFAWYVILQQPYITYLMYSGLFVILGIGADDIFVLVDAFKQSSYQPPHISGSLETRFAWAYNRAASAMLATSFTTAAAFASCAISPIWDISCFGCVTAAMIIADYILVITWLPAALIVNERYLQNCCLWCSPKCITASLGRTFNCCIGSRARYSQQHPAIDQATAVEMTSVQTMAENGSSQASSQVSAAQATCDNEKNSSEEACSDGDVTTTAPAIKVRALEEFYGGAFSSFIIDNAKLLVALFAVLFVAATLQCIFQRPFRRAE
mmetsp:Transcript_10211/g.18721  ORF Transcript_10211/g.18721 Transcript_10211/m.18721 type:complete len:559 (-) Transcript_10211:27-1703(-)